MNKPFDFNKHLQKLYPADGNVPKDTPTENEWSAAICKYLRTKGVFVHRSVGNFRTGAGIPDAWIGFQGMSVWIEFKGEKTKLQRNQHACIKRLKKAGANVFVYRYPDRLENEDGVLICHVSKRDLLMELQRLCGENYAFWAEAAKFFAECCNEDIKTRCENYTVQYNFVDADGVEQKKEMGSLWGTLLPILNGLHSQLENRSKSESD